MYQKHISEFQNEIISLGCQYGIKLYDWDGSVLIYDYNFHDNGIGVDDQLVTGAQAKGSAIFKQIKTCIP